ncbi:unnamed protein product [Amoebophrya sp. A120]|nr:unnamed protein product [Amoebophrya sp. A120]|eukprot:GSA120T00021723001.1
MLKWLGCTATPASLTIARTLTTYRFAFSALLLPRGPQQRFFGCQDAKTRKRNFARVREEQKAKHQRLRELDTELRRDEKEGQKTEGKKAGSSSSGSKLHFVASKKKKLSTW